MAGTDHAAREPTDLSLQPEVEEGVRPPVREAAINALKHAHPSRVSVEVEEAAGGALQLVIANDGRAFLFRGGSTMKRC